MPVCTYVYRFASPCALALLVALVAVGCAKKDPVTAASSGLRPADSEDAAKNPDNDALPTNGTKPARDDIGGGAPTKLGSPTTGSGIEKIIPSLSADDFHYKVPEGGSADVVAYLNDVTERIQQIFEKADAASPSEQAKLGGQLQRLFATRIEAAEKILNDEQATAEHRQLAAETAISSLAELAEQGDPAASGRLVELARTLEKDEDEHIRRLAAPFMLADELTRLQTKDSADPAKVIERLTALLDQEPEKLGFPHLMVAQNTATALLESQHPVEAARVLRLVGERFADAANPEVAHGARQLASQAFMIEVDDPLRRVMAEKEGAKEDLLAAARGAVARDEVELSSLEILERVANHLHKEHPETATAIVEVVREGVDKRLAIGEPTLADLTAVGDLADALRSDHAATAEQLDEKVRAGVDKLLADDQTTAAALTEIVNWVESTGQDAALIQAASEKVVPAARREIADAKAMEKVVPKLEELLDEVAAQLEQAGRLELAMGVCNAIAAATDEASDSNELKSLNASLADTKRRLGLVGEPFTVTGVTLDGEPFDWKSYEGKVVLVDFWASWCGPCLEEIPNIYANYNKYHDQGFEVVGVNMDDDLADVKNLFASRGKLPWPSVVSDDPAQRGAKNPLVRESGVSSIPFVLLVGKDGKVLDIHVRGEKLGEKLAELLGPPPEATDGRDAPPEETQPEDTSPRETPPTQPTP